MHTKRILSMILAIVMIVSMFAGITTASAAESVTLSFAGGSGANVDPLGFSDEASGITVTFAVGTHNTKPRWDASLVRFYGTASASNTLTVAAPEGGTITGIAFTMNGTYDLSKVSADSGAIEGTTWTGSANAVVFTTTAQTRFEGATVTYEMAAGAHVHEYAWDGEEGADGSHTLVCANADGACTALEKSEECTWVEGACSVCTVAEPTFTVTFSVPEGATAPEAVEAPTAGITLPELPVIEGYSAVGWATEPIIGSADVQPEVLDAEKAFVVTEATTLYAVYALATVTEGATVYTKVAAADVVAGDYYLAAQRSTTATTNYYFANGTVSSGDIVVTADFVEEIDGAVSALPEGAVALTLTGAVANGFTIALADGTYLGVTAYSNRKFAFSADYSTVIWKIVDGADKYAETKNAGNGLYMTNDGTNTDGTVAYYLFENSTGTGAIRGYAAWQSGSRPVYLFKAVTGTATTYTYYTDIISDTHVCADLIAYEAVTETCTTAGNSAYWACTCGKFYADAEAANEIEEGSWVIAATGHTTELKNKLDPTCLLTGYSGDEYCTKTECGALVNKGSKIAATGHKFTDGVCENCQATQLTANNVTELKDGQNIYIYNANTGLVLTNVASTSWKNYFVGVPSTVEGSVLTTSSDALLLTVHVVEGGYRFSNGDLYLTYGDTASSLSLAALPETVDPATDHTVWALDAANGYIHDVNSTYTYNDAKSFLYLQAYPTAGGFTAYYMTGDAANYALSFYDPNATCEHVWGEAVVDPAPTCAETGIATYICTLCGEKKQEIAEATGEHDFNEEYVCTVCGLVDVANKDYSGTYYIATSRDEKSNFFWMANTSDGKSRYDAIDSEALELPASIDADADMAKVWFLEKQEDGTYLLYTVADGKVKYVGWKNGNYAELLSEGHANIKNLTLVAEQDYVTLSFVDSDDKERFLSLNGEKTSNYFSFYTSVQKRNLSLVPVNAEIVMPTEYYLFGYINGADYAHNDDYANMGEYKFIDGKLIATFTTDSYVGVKTTDNAAWYMTDGYLGDVFTATLKNTSDTAVTFESTPDKLKVLAGMVEFELVVNEDGTLTLSYKQISETCPNGHTEGALQDNGNDTHSVLCATCNVAYGYPVVHDYVEGTCACGAIEPIVDYYLFGYINGANYGCEEDYENLGEYKFVDGKLTASFTMDSYVAVKNNINEWYMAETYNDGTVTTETKLFLTGTSASEKLFVPGGKDIEFTLVMNDDDTLTISYVILDPCANGHTEEIIPGKDATCTESGLTEGKKCSVCGDILVEQTVIDALGHTEEIISGKAATCTESGLTEGKKCSVCGETLVEQTVIDALGHTFVNGTCTTCGEADPDYDPYLDTNLTFFRKALVLESYIGSQFIIRTTALKDYTEFYVTFEHHRADGTVVKTTDYGAPSTASPSFMVYNFKGAAKEMTDIVDVTIYGKKGDEWYHSEAIEWSVATGVKNILAGLDYEAKATYVTLLADILLYGAAAQVNFEYNTENLASDVLTEAELDYATYDPAELTDYIKETANGTGVTFVKKALVLESAIEMQFIIKRGSYAAENLEARISYTLKGEEKTTVINGADFTPYSTSFSIIKFKDLAAKELRTVVTVEIYDKTTGECVSPSLTYSAESFSQQKIAADPDNNLAKLCKAMMCYVDAASAYFAEK